MKKICAILLLELFLLGCTGFFVFAKLGINLDVAALVFFATILFMAMFAFEIEHRVRLVFVQFFK